MDKVQRRFESIHAMFRYVVLVTHYEHSEENYRQFCGCGTPLSEQREAGAFVYW